MEDKKRFSHLKELLGRHKKATAELVASHDPMKYIQDHKNMSIKGLHGVAFARGGMVRGRK